MNGPTVPEALAPVVADALRQYRDTWRANGGGKLPAGLAAFEAELVDSIEAGKHRRAVEALGSFANETIPGICQRPVPVCSVQAASVLLEVSPQWIRRLAYSGELGGSARVGGRWLIDTEAVMAKKREMKR